MLTDGFRPGARRAIGRPNLRSRSATKSALPSGRPVPSALRSAANAGSSDARSRNSVAKSPTRSSTGCTRTNPSSAAARCARTLDHGLFWFVVRAGDGSRARHNRRLRQLRRCSGTRQCLRAAERAGGGLGLGDGRILIFVLPRHKFPWLRCPLIWDRRKSEKAWTGGIPSQFLEVRMGTFQSRWTKPLGGRGVCDSAKTTTRYDEVKSRAATRYWETPRGGPRHPPASSGANCRSTAAAMARATASRQAASRICPQSRPFER